MKIAVFCGSSDNVLNNHKTDAINIGAALSSNGHKLIYGGGVTGVMGAVNQGFRVNEGHITAVTVDRFHKKTDDEYATETIIVDSIEIRKRIMFDNADAYLVLPGSWGTIDEIAGIIMEAQYGIHNKPILFWGDFFLSLVEINNKIVDNCLAHPDELTNKIQFVYNIERLIELLK